MALVQINIQNLRNIEQQQIEFSPGLNLIIGPNASGKTSLLEAISLVCQGRSFRTPRIDQLVKHETKNLLAVAKLNIGKENHIIGLSREGKKTQVKIDGERIGKTTELVGKVALFILTPESHELLDSGPKMRRQYLDWGVFHVEHRYLDVWQKYHRILRQRNSSLRRRLSKQEIQAWDGPMAEQAEQLHSYRKKYLEELTPIFSTYGQHLIDVAPAFDYQPGWDESGSSLQEQLSENLEQLLRTIQQTHELKTFGVCHTCRHHQTLEHKNSFVCGLTKETLKVDTADLICREHES